VARMGWIPLSLSIGSFEGPVVLQGTVLAVAHHGACKECELELCTSMSYMLLFWAVKAEASAVSELPFWPW
jgi:hypothetical protein